MIFFISSRSSQSCNVDRVNCDTSVAIIVSPGCILDRSFCNSGRSLTVPLSYSQYSQYLELRLELRLVFANLYPVVSHPWNILHDRIYFPNLILSNFGSKKATLVFDTIKAVFILISLTFSYSFRCIIKHFFSVTFVRI